MAAAMATFVLAMLACSWFAATDANPGVSVRLSQEFFNVILHSELEPLLVEKLKKVSIAPVKFHIPTVDIDMTISEIYIVPNEIKVVPASTLTPNHETSSLEINIGIGLVASSKYHTRSRVWPHISSTGHMTTYFQPISVRLDMGMRPGPSGIWEFPVTKLLVAADVKVTFTGAIKILDVGAISDFINKEATERVTQAIRQQIAANLKKVTPMMEKYLPYLNYPKCVKHGLPAVCSNFALNLSLTSPGVWQPNCFAELQFNGYVVYKKKAYVPLSPPAFPPLAGQCGDRHVSVLLSGSLSASLVNAIFASGLVNFNVRSGKDANDTMYNKYIPEMSAHFGHAPLFFNVTLKKVNFDFLEGSIANNILVDFQILADVTPKKHSDLVFKEVFTMSVNVSVGLKMWIQPLRTSVGVFNTVFLNFSTALVNNVTILQSTFYIDDASVQKMLQTMMTTGFNNADDLLTEGALIIPPNVGKFRIIKPEIILGKGYMKIATNIDSVPVAAESPESSNESFAEALEGYVEGLGEAATDAFVGAHGAFMNLMVKSFTV